MIKIYLPQNKISLLDEQDAHLSNIQWSYKSRGYAARHWRRQDGKRTTVYLHHAVIGYPLNGLQVDHINGDRLDNRRSNLRIVTRRQNQQNQKCHRNGIKSSRFIGVSWNKKSNKWVSGISVDGKRRHLGYFLIEEDASQAYNSMLSSTLG